MVIEMVMENIPMQVENNIKVNGLKIIDTVKENTSMQMEKYMKVNG